MVAHKTNIAALISDTIKASLHKSDKKTMQCMFIEFYFYINIHIIYTSFVNNRILTWPTECWGINKKQPTYR